MRILSLRPTVALLACLLTATAPALDVDSGMDAIRLAQVISNPQVSGFRSQVSTSGWVRLRGIDLNKVQETREALLKLRNGGIRTCVFLRRSAKDWKVTYLPADLSEAYEYGRKLGATCGDLVDAWEVDNEPDLGFVPEPGERYTAFLKATYLGLKAGAREERADGGRQTSDASQQRAPLVIMGSLGLPPGPWLERFAANDGFAYTDGFNYHYYGYADDFSGVYQQHEAAVKELTSQVSGFRSQVSSASADKDLPIFMTEIGYGMLGKSARDTKEGRLRQWRWFKSVGEQIAALRPEAPMAFYLPPYLEYDTSEYGLTVPAKQETEKAETRKLKAEEWTAGGIEYSPGDFGTEKAEPWMANIGKQIGGNEITPALAQWLALRNAIEVGRVIPNAPSDADHGGLRIIRPTNNPQPITNNRDGARAWVVSAPHPSPIVIDFLPGEGLSHVKRFNGLFVIGKSPEVGRVIPNAPSERPAPAKPLPPTPSPSATPRSEECILQVRTQNGNLYEVYPTRQATPDWQRFLEPGANFTMAFYGRAALPWRFKDNKPISLVMVMYPKSLPATYEFRRPQLLKLSAVSSQPSASFRYGRGTVVLYNFSDKPVTGRLELPSALSPLPDSSESSASSAASVLKLLPHERREFPVTVKVPWDRYARIEAPITFVPEDTSIPPARFLTSLIPDIAGLPATLVAPLLAQRTDVRGQTTEGGKESAAYSNREIALSRPRASEEAPMAEQADWFAQPGATVQPTADGFSITVTALPPGKPQRIEVEIPWSDGLAFGEDEFLSVEFRLRP